MEYVEIRPLGQLAQIVRKVWSLRAEQPAGAFAPPQFEPVFPDGCMELVLNLGDSFERDKGSEVERQPNSLFVGQLLGPVHIRPTGFVNLIGIRFQPWGTQPLLENPAGELLGRLVTTDAIRWRIPGWLPGALYECESLEGRCQMLTAEFGAWYGRQGPLGGSGALEALATGAIDSVTRAARLTGRSTRHLERLCAERTGLTPRQLIRLARFQRALRLLGGEERRLVVIAAEAGYYDQPHFTREFGTFAGMTPLAYRRSRGVLTAAFVEETGDRTQRPPG